MNVTIESSGKNVQVLERAAHALDVIAGSDQPLASNEIAKATGLNASSLHRLLWTLNDLGFLEHREDGTWHLGLRFLEYSNRVMKALPVRAATADIMRSLFEKTGLAVHLSMRAGDSIIYVNHVCRADTGVRFSRQIGALAPLHCSSGGKLFLSAFTPDELAGYITRTGLKARTDKSIATRERLVMALDKVRERGWSEDNEELEYGIRCVGAPICDEAGRIIAAITLMSEGDMADKPRYVDLITKAAADASRLLAAAPVRQATLS